MDDYIKKAVELADGWRLSNDKEPLIYLDDGTSDGISFMSWSYPQFMLDALAAQLVRQINVLDDYAIHIEPGKTILCGVTYTDKGFKSHHTIGVIEGEDPTMSTIKAIVDSGVLSTGDPVP